MADVLIYGDTVRSPELRHEVPVSIGDPFLYLELGGERHVVIGSLEVPRLGGLGLEVHPTEEFGVDELRRNGTPATELLDEVALRAVKALGVKQAVVPAAFPLRLADKLRGAGIELQSEYAFFDSRRRVKSAAELAGIRRAQTAAEAGLTAARDLLRSAHVGAGGELVIAGELLTCERIQLAIRETVMRYGAIADELVVSHGAQSAIGHHFGEGVIRESEPIVMDLWPRDNESSCSADMTRTFVVGSIPDEVGRWHELCKAVLDRAAQEIRPGVTGRAVYDDACELFEAEGFPTQRTKPPGQMLEEGFFHALGHGVGLEVHEQPLLGMTGHDALLAGEVLAVEPGLYRPGLGGCRLEDLFLVTDGGAENLADFPYSLTP